nr:hypothetical protein [Anaerolineae bacterium]
MEGIKNVFSTIWKFWKKIGEFIGNVIGRIFLMIFYLTIALPFGLGVRLFSDPLKIKKAHLAPAWVERTSPEATIQATYNQF